MLGKPGAGGLTRVKLAVPQTITVAPCSGTATHQPNSS
jgi:hypothetical protein